VKKKPGNAAGNIPSKKAKINPGFSVEGSEHYYLPASGKISSCGFYVTSIGQARTNPGMPYPPVQHPSLYQFKWESGRVLPEFGIILVSEGQGVFESKPGGTVTVKAGMGVLLFPGVWHRYRPDPKVGWTERWIQFNGEFAHLLLNQRITNPENAVVSLPDFQEADTAFRLILENIRSAHGANSLLFSLQALGVLILAFRDRLFLSNAGKPVLEECGRDDLVELALEYIWTRSHKVLSVSDVAEAAGVPRRTLERHMIEFTGQSILGAIIDCRFLRAERLLRETDIPIKIITSLAGFGSEQNMRHLFLTRVGCSPAVYRERDYTNKNGSTHSGEATMGH
jgi:AraC-like DNA-binding protein